MIEDRAVAWSLPHVVEYFDNRRTTTKDVYPSEWFFLKDRLIEGMSVLDIGCAQGGFASVIAEHLKSFSYTGLDISTTMIEKAQSRFPQHSFHVIKDNNLTVINPASYDLVICLGILHLNTNWRPLIGAAWSKTKGALVLDLRLTDGKTIEDEKISYFKWDDEESSARTDNKLPYNVINMSEASQLLTKLCPEQKQIYQYGYWHPVSGHTVSPAEKVLMMTYSIIK